MGGNCNMTDLLPALTKAAPSHAWIPPYSGTYHLAVGATNDSVWDGGTLNTTHWGATVDALSAVTADKHLMVHLVSGKPVVFTVSGAGNSTNILIGVSLDPEWTTSKP